MTSSAFRDLLGDPGCVVIPAVYAALSARIAERVRRAIDAHDYRSRW